jgi:hypothetical protein
MPERDWKVFRQLRPVALERFCERVLSRIKGIVRSGDTAHQRYLRVFKVIDEQDRELAALFNNPRRSTAWSQLLMICAQGLLTPEEMQRFSEDTQRRISENTGLRI